ncbi:Serine/threonine-protein phosphatase 6 regulatory ankyrin repeat like [Verticillium longisporum]|uniref:Serine/threonine-protein phosphatase 6 regulatory ankyrin repeat like n=1 Tax=Verticillium longisporum TaxID=100787 RepID=A0A8I2ZB05_VERLO|nr:Serine/threonine-protein phosphatase 6 regulatory ankyrin repeat like [Verticillium longisporum]
MGWAPSFFGRRPSESDYKKWGRNVSVYDEKLLMADPLSLTASIITVLGVAGATAAAVQKVQEFRNAPLDVIALGNEITDVRLLFTVIENTIELKTFKTTSIETSVGLLALLERARDLLEQIQDIHQRILPPGPVGKQNGDKPKISRRLWVKERKNVVMLLKHLRQTRQNLQTAISCITCHQTSAIPEAHMTIQTSLEDLKTSFAARFDEFKAELVNLQKPQIQNEADADPSLEKTPHLNRQSSFSSSASTLVGITGSYTYHFPSWMVAKAVFFEMFKNDLLGYSASWTLHIPKVLGDGDPIWRFINYGTVPQVSDILSKKQVSACDMNRDGKSLLHFAVEFERPDICKYLLTQGVSRFFQDDTGFTASMMACEKVLPPTASKERIEKQDQLRQVFQDDDLAETMDFPPLTLAILRLPEADFASHLDLNFASINVQDTLGRTPLIWATALRKPLIAQLLVDYGADTSLTDKHSKTALHWAMISQSKDVAEVLINGAANLEARDVFGRTALHEIAKVAQSADMINLLLDSGAVLDAKDARYERTPLYLATYHGRTENMTVLLDRGADIEVVGPMSGHTPLLAAVAYNRSASVELLLSRGADVSAIDKGGRNILHNVAKYGSAAIMRAITAAMSLTPHGCVEVELVDQKGLTAEEYFLQHRNEYYNGEISGEDQCWAELIRVARG